MKTFPPPATNTSLYTHYSAMRLMNQRLNSILTGHKIDTGYLTTASIQFSSVVVHQRLRSRFSSAYDQTFAPNQLLNKSNHDHDHSPPHRADLHPPSLPTPSLQSSLLPVLVAPPTTTSPPLLLLLPPPPHPPHRPSQIPTPVVEAPQPEPTSPSNATSAANATCS